VVYHVHCLHSLLYYANVCFFDRYCLDSTTLYADRENMMESECVYINVFLMNRDAVLLYTKVSSCPLHYALACAICPF
jgi:hypothetical protein